MVSLNMKLPEDFISEEIKCDYLVTKQMKEVWAVELDLLKQIQDVCKKHNIQYVASGGTLLGAVRHKGFIPWDDDIDIAILREDYEKLCSLHQEFKFPYELQFYDKTQGYFTGHAQLRNQNTTGVLKSSLHKLNEFSYNQGIFIDIFPLDSVSDDHSLQEKHIQTITKYKKMSKRIYNWTEGYHTRKASIKHRIMHVLCKFISKKFSYDYYYKKFIAECVKYNDIETKYVGMLSFMPGNKKLYIERKYLNEITETDFEFMKIAIETNYDSILKMQYDDYMKFVKGGCYHGGVIFDTDMPFKQWLKAHYYSGN